MNNPLFVIAVTTEGLKRKIRKQFSGESFDNEDMLIRLHRISEGVQRIRDVVANFMLPNVTGENITPTDYLLDLPEAA